MPCSWQKEDYFSQLMAVDKKSHTALEMLVDDLHADKEKTVNKFLCHSGSEDFLWGLVALLGNDTARVAGNAAYILGTVAESEIGCMRVLSLVNQNSSESKKILPHLTRMLTFDDSESVMNAAGTMGTLAESHEGREWILNEKCLPQTLDHITSLLHSENLWTASNAALVLARLSISEYGCSRMLEHDHSQHILSKLIISLGVDEAGRGMNAAFAIGRLCDMDQGRKRLLQLSDSERMISSLAKMLSCDDTGASKNACFALSCLATNSEGHNRLLSNKHSEEILRTLAGLLNADDSETGWFAAMTLRTLASQPKGCLRLREHPQVITGLKGIEVKEEVNPDLKEEAIITLEILKRLPKPSPPTLTPVSPTSLRATWEPIVTKSGFQVRYQLFDGTKCVYTGKNCECDVVGLIPNTAYVYKMRAYTEGDESPFSDIVSIITEESVPGPPQSVRILGTTITQLKVGWDPPLESGTVKAYYVYLDDKEVQHTPENSVILTSLTASTTYQVEVCAANSKGRGDRSGTSGTTADIGAHAPSKPQVNVIGRNELYVTWGAPEVPLGRLNRYDVIMNDKVIYSGSDLNLPVRRLVPDTEYSFVIVALTSEGKFESKTTKKRTAKDEYDQARPPLYQPPKKESLEEGAKTPVNSQAKKRKSSAGRVHSAKHTSKRGGREHVKSGSLTGTDARPSSAGSSVASIIHDAHPIHVDRTASSSPSPPQSFQLDHSGRSSPLRPSSGKPIAEVRYEPTVTKPRTPRTLNKIERPIHSANMQQQRVLLSTVSMQNNKSETSSSDTNKDKENKTTDLSSNACGTSSSKKLSVPAPGPASGNNKNISGVVQNNKNENDKTMMRIGNSGMKIERSRTSVTSRDLRNSGRDLRKGKYSQNSSAAQNSNSNNFENDNSGSSRLLNSKGVFDLVGSAAKGHDLVGSANKGHDLGEPVRKERSRPGTNDRDSNVSSRRSKQTEDIAFNKPEVQVITKDRDGLKLTSSNVRERSGKVYGSLQNDRGKSRENVQPRGVTEKANLPKPSPPSQKYLEGQTTQQHESPWGQRSALSPKSSKDTLDSDWLTQVKSISDNYARSHAHNVPLHHAPADSTYYIDSTQFLQRTNTYISSHRPMVGRRSLEKLQKSSPSLKFSGSNPSKVGSSMNLEMDIPEHQSTKLANKFIPMQLRTQPSNLGIGQLQRVNTTLMGDLTGRTFIRDAESDNSVSFRRVEAITRSQTQIDMKQLSPQAHIPMDNRRDLVMPTNKDRQQGGGGSRRTSGSSQPKVLGGSQAAGSHRGREPDSMLLQQSWGMNSSSDLAAMQNVR